MFYNPSYITVDLSNNLVVWDSSNYRIRRISPDGTVSTFAGGGLDGSLTFPGYGTNLDLSILSIGCIAMDYANAVWATTSQGGSGGPGGTYTLALRIGANSYGSLTRVNGASTLSGVCIDSANNLYFADVVGNRIYRYATNGLADVFAGSGNPGAIDGNWVFTSFYRPAALAIDTADNIYVWDSGNRLIRRINANRDVVTIAGRSGAAANVDGVGTNASFNSVAAMCVDGSGSLILACGSSIRKMTAVGKVTTIAGSFSQNAYTNGAGPLARFSGASGVCISQGTIFVADSGNQRIRSIAFVPAPLVRTQPQPQTSCLGQTATFEIRASGGQPLSYQWWSQAGPLSGQTSTNLVLTNLLSSQAGAYWVVVTNTFGSVTSAPAQLVVNDACVGLRMYAGLDMVGQAGRAYVLSYVNDPTSTNWIALATNTLGSSNWFFLDMDSPFQTKRFYKVNLKP